MLAAVLSRRGAMCLFFWFLKYKGFPQASFLGQEDTLEKEDRGTWWATVHVLQRVRHNWQTEHAYTKYKDSFIDKLTNWRPIHLLRIICFEFSTSDNDFFILQKNRNRIYSCMYVYMLCLILSHVWLFVTPWTVAHQALLSLGVLQARILEWVAVPFSRRSSHPGIKHRCPTLQVNSLLSQSPGKPMNTGVSSLSLLQGIFLTQKWYPSLLHCRWLLYQLSYQA